MNNKKRAIKASINFLRFKGYEVVDTNIYNDFTNIIAEDIDGILHMINVQYCTIEEYNFFNLSFDKLEAKGEDIRNIAEKEAMFWLAENDSDKYCIERTQVIFDNIVIVESTSQKAMLRHRINVLR